ncbi:MAG: hypothetical protein ACRDY5_05830, partial [Acidimicrobiales bacterium]
MPYSLPGDDIVAIIDAPPTPGASVSPDGRHVLLIHYEAHPPVALLARPFLRLAGVRVDPVLRGRHRSQRTSGISLVSVADGCRRSVALPDGVMVDHLWWSPDSRRIAFTLDEVDRIGVWVVGVDDGVAAPVPGLVVSDILGTPYRWSRDSAALLASVVPTEEVGRPAVHPEILEPRTQETVGKASQMATFQNLLTSATDEDRFEALATTGLARVDPVSGAATGLADPGLLAGFTESPDGGHVLLGRLRRPFSFRVPYHYFARTLEVWSGGAALEAVIAEWPVSDEVPRQGVPTGPRHVAWHERAADTLLWTEALDGGDPVATAEHRDRVVRARAPFDDPVEILRTRHRCHGWVHLDEPDRVVLAEYDRDRRWQTTWLVPLDDPDRRRVLFDLSVNDAYGDPGRAVRANHRDGTQTALQRGASIFLHGDGATPEGRRPFLDRRDLADGATQRLH